MSLSEHRLPEPPAAGFEDDDAAREYGRQLAMDLLLHRLHHAPSEQRSDRPRATLIPWLAGIGSAAAAAIAVGYFMFYLPLDKKAPESRRWKVEPAAAAEFAVVEPFHVRLDHGELRVPAAPDRNEVRVETEFASVVAIGAEFRISQESKHPADPRPFGQEVTTIRVVSGTLTLTTPEGTVVGHAGETLVAVEGEAPRKE